MSVVGMVNHALVVTLFRSLEPYMMHAVSVTVLIHRKMPVVFVLAHALRRVSACSAIAHPRAETQWLFDMRCHALHKFLCCAHDTATDKIC
jgi:hypothetical protein